MVQVVIVFFTLFFSGPPNGNLDVVEKDGKVIIVTPPIHTEEAGGG
jgi:hypothetical protein